MGLKKKNFYIIGVYWKIWLLGRIHKKPMYKGELPKKGEGRRLGVFADLKGGEGGGLSKREGGGGVFETELIPQCALCGHSI